MKRGVYILGFLAIVALATLFIYKDSPLQLSPDEKTSVIGLACRESKIVPVTTEGSALVSEANPFGDEFEISATNERDAVINCYQAAIKDSPTVQRGRALAVERAVENCKVKLNSLTFTCPEYEICSTSRQSLKVPCGPPTETILDCSGAYTGVTIERVVRLGGNMYACNPRFNAVASGAKIGSCSGCASE
jgi:hypothetical protein